MKQFIDENRAKELKSIIGEPTSVEVVEKKMFRTYIRYNYSLGDLLMCCPLKITVDGKVYDRTIIGNKLRYRTVTNCQITYGKNAELIDNLYAFIVDFYKNEKIK